MGGKSQVLVAGITKSGFAVPGLGGSVKASGEGSFGKAVKQAVKEVVKKLLSVLPAPKMPMIAHDGLHLRWRAGWLNGWVYRARWAIGALFGGPRVKCGARFAVQGKLRVKGPGRVVFGDDVLVDSNTDLFTHSRDALIEIGSSTFVNGSRMGCAERISIGERCILADARFTDTDFHAVSKNRQSRTATVRVSSIDIGANVWIAANAAILRGVTIGQDSVVGFGAVVTRTVPAGVLVGGNPAKVIGEVGEGEGCPVMLGH